MTLATTTSTRQTGLRRSIRLIRLYLREQEAPDPFYNFLAEDTFDRISDFTVAGQTDHLMLDVGGGPGFIDEEARKRGYSCAVIEYEEAELRLHGRIPDRAAVGDGQARPVRDHAVSFVHCSNVLEHVQRPELLLAEMVRVTRPGGVGYLSFTPWLSPWGGHETSPWHFFGGEKAAVRYAERNCKEPKNRFGRNLFALHLSTVRQWFMDCDDVEILWDGPRYWPSSWKFLTRIPVLGEILAWNYLVIFRIRDRS